MYNLPHLILYVVFYDEFRVLHGYPYHIWRYSLVARVYIGFSFPHCCISVQWSFHYDMIVNIKGFTGLPYPINDIFLWCRGFGGFSFPMQHRHPLDVSGLVLILHPSRTLQFCNQNDSFTNGILSYLRSQITETTYCSCRRTYLSQVLKLKSCLS